MPNKYTYSLPFTKEQLEADYSSGMSQVEIAERYHTTQRVVQKAMKNLGVKARSSAKRNQRGENNDSWKGSDVSYAAYHYRVESLRGKPKHCEVCGTSNPLKHYDWANLSGRYDDPYDYKRMCRSCHWKHDKKHLNLGDYAQRKEVRDA